MKKAYTKVKCGGKTCTYCYTSAVATCGRARFVSPVTGADPRIMDATEKINNVLEELARLGPAEEGLHLAILTVEIDEENPHVFMIDWVIDVEDQILATGTGGTLDVLEGG